MCDNTIHFTIHIYMITLKDIHPPHQMYPPNWNGSASLTNSVQFFTPFI